MNKIEQFKDQNLNYVSVEHDDFKVILVDHAASLFQIYFDNKPMTVQIEDTDKFKDYWLFFGKTVGRVAGRIEKGILNIDGKIYQLSTNEMGNTLHGGWQGISQQQFTLSNIENNDVSTTVSYTLTTPDGLSGWPGIFKLDVNYVISATKPELEIYINAICDQKTPINLTNHVFFNLGDPSIDNLWLKINSDRYLFPRELDLLPIEERAITPCLDFSQGKSLIKDINEPEINVGRKRGYDHFFFFKEENKHIPQVQLENDKYHLDVYTTNPGVKIYTDNFLDQYKCINTTNFFHRGVAIEAQCSDLENLMVEPNTKIIHWIKFSLRKK